MLATTLEKHAAEAPDEVAFICGDNEITWRAFDETVRRFVVELKSFAGKRILGCIDARTSDDLALLVASSEVSAEFVLISPFHKRERVFELLEEFDGDFALSGRDGKIEILAERNPKSSRPAEPGAFVCLLTSGTTGTPKCARFSWDRLSDAVNLNSRFAGRRWMMGYHLTSFAGMQVFLQCFTNRGCLVIPNSWPPSSAADIAAIERYGVQYLNCTATYLRKLLFGMKETTTANLRCVTLGGEVVDQSAINSFKAKFPEAKLNHVYASTELGAAIEVKDEREGFPISFLDEERLRVVDGELHVRRSSRSMLGYLSGNLTVIGNDLVRAWVPTGDLVEIKGERVLFAGRRDSIINVGGFKVNPLNVEATIREVEGIREVVVSGMKNPISGSLLKAQIVLTPGTDPADAKTRILAACKDRQPYYAVPRIFEFSDEIAYTSTFKIKR